MEALQPQVTGRRSAGGSFTIPEWCEHRRLSLSMYYKLRAQGKAPATLSVGCHKTTHRSSASSNPQWIKTTKHGMPWRATCAKHYCTRNSSFTIVGQHDNATPWIARLLCDRNLRSHPSHGS